MRPKPNLVLGAATSERSLRVPCKNKSLPASKETKDNENYGVGEMTSNQVKQQHFGIAHPGELNSLFV